MSHNIVFEMWCPNDDCKDYEENMKKIVSAQIFCYTHGIKYDGKAYKYCPWCGTELAWRNPQWQQPQK
jgi:hypothetical protein